MANIDLELTAEEKESVFSDRFNHRLDAAKVFPHCSETFVDFIGNYQGVKLTRDEIKALGRG